MRTLKALAALWLAMFCIAAQAQRDLPDFTRLVEEQGGAVVNISTTQAVRRAALLFDQAGEVGEIASLRESGGAQQDEPEARQNLSDPHFLISRYSTALAMRCTLTAGASPTTVTMWFATSRV